MGEGIIYLLTSFWLGAVHAATPGHGKTIAASYIVGVRGRPVDALVLGIFVTLSHTSGIVVVAVLATLGSAWLIPQRIEAYLAVGTGILVIGIGCWMLRTQMRLMPVAAENHARPHPYMGCLRVKGFLFGLVIGEVVHRSTVSLFDRAPFLRPDLVLRGRRAQPRSRLAAGHRRRRRAAALRAASTAPPLAGSGWPSGGGQRVSLERGPWRRASAGLASPYIRSSGTALATLIPHARSRSWPNSDGTYLRERQCLARG
ncbi:MAG: hypothetical protein E6G83_19010 [Alphaproteobacteria bacterium]|nr:MAG: hypothetical protein E6G83_19010 [Alphaproteobacteria bacterium]